MQLKTIGERIKSSRLELDISASELADRLHMSRATVFRYENGEIKTIKIPVIISIANELKVNPAWLLGKTDRKEPLEHVTRNNDYTELANIFDDLMAFIEYREDIECHGKRMKEEDRLSVASSLKIVFQMIETRYK